MNENLQDNRKPACKSNIFFFFCLLTLSLRAFRVLKVYSDLLFILFITTTKNLIKVSNHCTYSLHQCEHSVLGW